jgi:hypothetical protein
MDGDGRIDRSVIMSGPTTVRRASPAGTSPATIDTEIISMSLTSGGVTLTAGAGLGTIPLRPSPGTIVEQVGDNTQADSFFDVFFEIELEGGVKLYNHLNAPLHVAATIGCAPPEAEFRKDPQPVPLFTHPELGDPTPFQVITVRHFVPPPPPEPKIGACCLPSNGCVLGLTDFDCHAIVGGHFEGDGTTFCRHNPNGSCTTGACCLPNNGCTLDTTQEECVKLGGHYSGDGTTECFHNPATGDCIPTVSQWGLVVMAMLVLTAGTVVVMRRRAMVRGGS